MLLQHSQQKQTLVRWWAWRVTVIWGVKHLGTWQKKQLFTQIWWCYCCLLVKDFLLQEISIMLWESERVVFSKWTVIMISTFRAEFSLLLWEVQLREDYRSSCRRCSVVPLVLIQRGMSQKIIWGLTLIFEFVEEQLLENSLLVYFPSLIQDSLEQ